MPVTTRSMSMKNKSARKRRSRRMSTRSMSAKRLRNKAYYTQSRKVGCRKQPSRACVIRSNCKMANGRQRRFCRTKKNRRY